MCLIDAKINPRSESTTPTGIPLHVVRPLANGTPSAKTAQVSLNFGLPADLREITILDRATIPLSPGKITLLAGPSGSGKSTALAEIQRHFARAALVHKISFPPQAALIDAIEPTPDIADAIAILTACGIGEAPAWVRTFDALSEGEKFRARLARAIALQMRDKCSAPLLCDEFCSGLHRRLAKAISFNLRKIVTKFGLTFVAATSNEDIIRDLDPDVFVRLQSGGKCETQRRAVAAHRTFTVARRLCIERGLKRDYEKFASMHYRPTDELGFVDKVFTLRDGRDGEMLGIVVYSHAPLELSLRNQATNGWFVRNPKRVNRHLRILRRLVIHSDLRGCGLGHLLVARTLPLVGVKFVECLAAMGEFNPVFEKAGMQRIGQLELSQNQRAAALALKEMGVDPHSPEFVHQADKQPRVRHLVAKFVYDWYSATTANGRDRVKRQSPQFLAQLFRSLIGVRPVYYLWQRMGFNSRKQAVRNSSQRSRICIPKSEIGNWKSAMPPRPSSAVNRQSPISNRKLEIGNWKLEIPQASRSPHRSSEARRPARLRRGISTV